MEQIYIAGVILLVGILLFLFLSTRRKYRDPSSAQRYEKITEKLTAREPEPEEDEEEYDRAAGFEFHFSLSNLIASFVVILIGVSLLPEISNQVEIASFTINSTGADTSSLAMNLTILKMMPAFFALGMLFMAIAFVYSSFRRVS